jgi:PAS domain S-box-containing protein
MNDTKPTSEPKQAEDRLHVHEKRFRALIEHSADVILLLDPKGTILFYAPARHRILGYASEDFVGRDAVELLHPEERETARRLLAEAVQHPAEPLAFQFRARHQDDSWRWLEGTATNLLAEPPIQAIVVNYRDITDRKCMEEALRRSEELNRHILEVVPGGIVKVLPDGSIHQANAEAQRILGLSWDELSRRFVHDFATQTFWEDGRPCAVADYPVTKCLQTGQAQPPATIGVRRPDGQISWAIYTAVPIRDVPTGRPAGAVVTFLDITARKQTEEKLRESEERHRLIADLTSDYTYTCHMTPDGVARLDSVSEGFSRVTGYTLAEVEARGGWTSFLHPEDLGPLLQKMPQVLAGDRVVDEVRFCTKSGATRWIRYSVQAIQDPVAGRAIRLLGAVQDITERKQAEEALRQTNQTLESLIRASPLAIISLDNEGRITMWNPAAERIFGWQSCEVQGGYLPIIPGEKRQEFEASRDAELRGETRVAVELRRLRKDGTLVDISIWTAPVRDDQGVVRSTIGILADITERKHAEAQLHEYAYQLRCLSHRLLEVQEQERRHLVRELHDEIGQSLTGLQLTLELCTRLPEKERAASLARAQRLLKELTEQVRDLSLRLRPTMLDDLGLLPALVWFCQRYTAQTGVHVVFEQNGLERRFPAAVETAAYRIVQEALTNVARHAAVRTATVRLWLDQDRLCLQIADQGVGFDFEAARTAGTSHGLSGMLERALLLGGRLTVESRPGAGTHLTAELPIRQ